MCVRVKSFFLPLNYFNMFCSMHVSLLNASPLQNVRSLLKNSIGPSVIDMKFTFWNFREFGL